MLAMDDIVELLLNPLSLLVLIILLTITYVWKQQHQNCGYPPGPFSLPLIGNLPQVALCGSMVKFLKQYRKVYGDIFTIELGGHRRVVISGYDNMYQLFIKDADFTSNRHIGSLTRRGEAIVRQRPGIMFSSFPHWKTMRSFALNILRDEGMGKVALEPQIISEIEKFCDHFIEPRLGEPIDLTNDIPKATYNIISELIFGGRSDYDDPEFTEMVESLVGNIASAAIEAIFKNIPVLRYFVVRSEEQSSFVRKLVKQNIDEHRRNLNTDDPKDIIDEYLNHQKKLSEQEIDDHCFTDGNLLSVALQLYSAGTDTTSNALKWALLLTTYHPDVIKKVQEEIRDEIGFEKDVSTMDRNHMPYTDAVLLETLRIANIVPMSLPHLLEKDILLDGKMVPAGSDLLMNMASVLHDEEMFDSPERFDPNRYLTGDVALKKKRTIPFSLGRRVCLGESLARMEFFLLYVTFMQKYEIKLAEDESFEIKLSGKPSVINSPQPYRLIFTKRL